MLIAMHWWLNGNWILWNWRDTSRLLGLKVDLPWHFPHIEGLTLKRDIHTEANLKRENIYTKSPAQNLFTLLVICSIPHANTALKFCLNDIFLLAHFPSSSDLHSSVPHMPFHCYLIVCYHAGLYTLWKALEKYNSTFLFPYWGFSSH